MKNDVLVKILKDGIEENVKKDKDFAFGIDYIDPVLNVKQDVRFNNWEEENYKNIKVYKKVVCSLFQGNYQVDYYY